MCLYNFMIKAFYSTPDELKAEIRNKYGMPLA